MKNPKLQKLVRAALLAALCCVATMVIQIPSPMHGYVNLGDCFVLLAGWMLGPAWGFFAAGIGSALADALTGYFHYVPGTFVIKGLMALLAALLLPLLNKALRHALPARIVSSVVCEGVMAAGYFGYASLLLGKGLAAAASVPGNLIQGAFAVAAAVMVSLALSKTPLMPTLEDSR